jgi:hypothetical protein
MDILQATRNECSADETVAGRMETGVVREHLAHSSAGYSSEPALTSGPRFPCLKRRGLWPSSLAAKLEARKLPACNLLPGLSTGVLNFGNVLLRIKIGGFFSGVPATGSLWDVGPRGGGVEGAFTPLQGPVANPKPCTFLEP